MEHPIDAFERLGHGHRIRDVGHPHLKLWIGFVLLEVARVARRHVVNDPHRTTEGEQSIRQMGADESSSAGNKVKHRIDHLLMRHGPSLGGVAVIRISLTPLHSKKMKPQSP